MGRYLLTQAVDKWARETPKSEAVRFNSEGLTYAELSKRSNQLARALLDCGLKRTDRVGIYMNKSLNSAIAIYGIMKAGGAYVPLDPFAPTERIRFVINDCDIHVLISTDAKIEAMTEMEAAGWGIKNVIGLSKGAPLESATQSWDEVGRSYDGDALKLELVEQDLAYILYTSGSTGVPKGIMHTHRSGLSFAEWGAATYALDQSDRLSNHAPLHFDLSTFDFFAGHIAGATTIIVPEAQTKFPASMVNFIEQEGITVWYSVPYALIQMLLRGKLGDHDLSSLRWVLFAGEPFPTKHLRNLMAELPGASFSNLYGPTETNVCTFFNLPAKLPQDDAPIPIGVPCSNVETLIVDEDDAPIQTGEVGELLIRGGVVMRGYWGQPEKTQRCFFLREQIEASPDIFYRTGDLVREQTDGNLEYLGRKDRQIKTRGYRVELDEIEVALLAIEGVQQAAVYPVPDGEGSNLIEAAVIFADGKNLDPESVIDILAGRLPQYALPARINIHQEFPRTSTGKINRRVLQEGAALAASVAKS
jgi:amino acid adenylation domain-containing protein